jgi:hypothetical protein
MCQGLGAREGVETRYSPLSHSFLDGDGHSATAFIDTRTIIFGGRVGRLLWMSKEDIRDTEAAGDIKIKDGGATLDDKNKVAWTEDPPDYEP